MQDRGSGSDSEEVGHGDAQHDECQETPKDRLLQQHESHELRLERPQ